MRMWLQSKVSNIRPLPRSVTNGKNDTFLKTHQRLAMIWYRGYTNSHYRKIQKLTHKTNKVNGVQPEYIFHQEQLKCSYFSLFFLTIHYRLMVGQE